MKNWNNVTKGFNPLKQRFFDNQLLYMFKFFALLCCFSLSSILLAQDGIQTENNLGVEALVKNVFIKGNCRNVSNISAIGNEIISIGQFENGADVIKRNLRSDGKKPFGWGNTNRPGWPKPSGRLTVVANISPV